MGQCEIRGSVKSLSLRETRDLELLLINECPLMQMENCDKF